MTDLERLLTEALRESGENYEPSDQAEARRRFLERARRRRWYGFAQVAAVAGVGIATFLFFASQPGTDRNVEPQPEPPAGAPQIVATVAVDGEPMSIDAADGSAVWVAGDGRIVSVDPITNEAGAVVTDRPADEVAVGGDSVWIARDGLTGYIDRVDLSTGEGPIVDNVRTLDGEGNSITWDIAASGDSLMAVDGVTGNVYRFGNESRPEGMFREFIWSDVAVGEGYVWLLDQEAGTLVTQDIQRLTGVPSLSFTVPAGRNSDLAAGLGYVWVSEGHGTLVRVDPSTGDLTSLRLGDSYADLTVDENSVWALVDDDDEPKQLVEIDPATMEVIGEPLEIEGDANDVVAAAGSVWVADGRGEVLRIEPSRDADDAPPPAEDDQTNVEPLPPEEKGSLLFVYSANGDLFGQKENGDVAQLTSTPETEQYPSFSPDGKSILFTRDVYDSFDDEIPDTVRLDLETGDEELVADGSWPAMASDGRLATVEPNSTVNGETAAAIDIWGGPDTVPDVIGGDPDFPSVSHVSWVPGQNSVVFQATGENAVIRNASLDHESMKAGGVMSSSEHTTILGPPSEDSGLVETSDFTDGSTVVSPYASADGWVYVLRMCCRERDGDPFEELFAGRLQQQIEGIAYEDIAPIPDIEGIEPSFETSLVPAGHLDYDELRTSDDRWTSEGAAQSWFVIDDDMMWLVDGDGAAHYISGDSETSSAPGHEGETDFRGLAVHPSLLEATEG